MPYGHSSGTVSEIPVENITPGMVGTWHDGEARVVYDVTQAPERAEDYLVSYRSVAPSPDGNHNTDTIEVPVTASLPIIVSSIAHPVSIDS